MKKILFALLLLPTPMLCKSQVNIPRQEIRYDVNYHWGLVDVMIAHGVVTLQTNGELFYGTLDGNSIPWEGRIFCVSDTLHARMSPGTPLSRETVTYESGWYMKPKVREYRNTGFDPENPVNYRNISGEGTLDASSNTMEAINVTADMLGMFYYFHEIDFESMSSGQSITIPIEFSGGEPEKVVVTYDGKSHYTVAGVTYPTYKTQFEYSYRGRMSGYPVMAHVGVSDRIPLLLSASLPIGKVEMIYAP